MGASSGAGTGAEWLEPAVPPLTPEETPEGTGEWFGPGGAVVPVSIAVLPGGTVHTWGTVMSQSRDLVDGTHPAWSAAAWQARDSGRPTPVSVGHADGRVDAYLVAADGTATLDTRPRRPVAARRPPDPCWGEPLELPHALCTLEPDAHTVEAIEQTAANTAMEGDHEGATHYYTVAAARRHALGPGDSAAADRAVRLAVASWLRTTTRPSSTVLGYALVHLLISTFPDRPGPIAALLRRLADFLPAAAHPVEWQDPPD